MSWDSKSRQQPDGPFDDPPERQKIRQATEAAQQEAERKEVLRRYHAAIRRWAAWISGGFIGFVATIIAAGQLPDGIVKLIRFFKGGP